VGALPVQPSCFQCSSRVGTKTYIPEMGFSTRMLVLRGVRRAAHPVRSVKRAVTPKVVKRARRALSPVDNAVYSVDAEAEHQVSPSDEGDELHPPQLLGQAVDVRNGREVRQGLNAFHVTLWSEPALGRHRMARWSALFGRWATWKPLPGSRPPAPSAVSPRSWWAHDGGVRCSVT
jgi:hypothetical protein